ncbi:MAG: hypothetical protein LIP09_05790 [Bacteroidales bacterium]|nr:hypothetical protein [Bacteroidales bacterium]
MKKLLSILTILMIACTLGAYAHCAAKEVIHMVDRGEDLNSIAELYCTTPAAISKANYDLTEIYCGMELVIPITASDYDLQLNQAYHSNSLYSEAEYAYKCGDYKQAVKLYDQIIKGGSPLLLAYYKRGMAQYQRDKLGPAYEDFSYVASHDTEYNFPDAESYCEQIYEIQQQRSQENAQFWGALVQTVAVAGLSAYEMSQQSKQQSTRSSSSSSSSSSGGFSYSSYDSSSSSSNNSSTTKSQSKCGLCGGKGFTVESVISFGLAEKEYCSECGKTMMSNHYHKKCTQCGGNGYR